MEHLTVQANGAAFHVARTGAGPAAAVAAWLAGILADLGAGDDAACRSLHAVSRPTCAASATATSRTGRMAPTSMPPTCWR